jgi:hypothetical protein
MGSIILFSCIYMQPPPHSHSWEFKGPILNFYHYFHDKFCKSSSNSDPLLFQILSFSHHPLCFQTIGSSMCKFMCNFDGLCFSVLICPICTFACAFIVAQSRHTICILFTACPPYLPDAQLIIFISIFFHLRQSLMCRACLFGRLLASCTSGRTFMTTHSPR